MERRDFFKILSTSAAAAAATSCGGNSDALIPLLVPEHNIPIGEERWHPAVCTECSAGCGTIVRVMGAERIIEQKGEKVRQRIAAIKKIEGNPLDPVSGGHLCARGQAVVQALYHPDRLQSAMKRQGDRGSGNFTKATWDEAIAGAADKIKSADPSRIVFLTGPNAGTRSAAIDAFLKAIKAPAATVCSLNDHAIERKAAEQALGWKGLPVYDIANADHVLSIGADFLGGWTSPVYYARQFGNLRQGRVGVRGNLFHAESRFSVTARAADKWLPILPGTEPQFIAAVSRFLDDPQAADLPAAFKVCGLEQKRTFEILHEFASSKAPLVVGGASTVHTNSLEAVVASLKLNQKLGNIGKPGGVLQPAPAAIELASSELAGRLANAQVIIIDSANPAYTMPASSGILDALKKAGAVISLAPVIDDSAAYADFILPADHALESTVAVAPSVSRKTGMAVAAPFIQPLYETQPIEKTLGDIAGKLGANYTAPAASDLVKNYADAVKQGGSWEDVAAAPPKPAVAPKTPVPTAKPAPVTTSATAQFAGDASQFPLYFQPYYSTQFGDGASSHLPWMQELPDPTSSAIWSVPVELDAKTAGNLSIEQGDLVRIESPNGAIEAPAFINPAAIPGVVSMAIGGGHTHYTRYGTGHSANPISILAPTVEQTTGAIATGATRVKLTRVSDAGNLIQFSTQTREARGAAYR